MPGRVLPSLDGVVRGRIASDPASLRTAGRDASHLAGAPLAVVSPVDEDEVRALIGWARRHRLPLVARGGGTSLDGESVPSDGSVVVDLSGWDRVEAIDPGERVAYVGPGVVNWGLQRAVAPHGLFYPPNPGSWTSCTIGGNVATNASGPRSYRYGPTRAWVRELDVVLGNGRRLRLGTRAAKRSVGPELLSLIVGSEGTLGIVTRIGVRLAPTPPVRRGLLLPVPDGTRLGELAVRLGRAGAEGLSAIEYVDRASAEALERLGRPLGPAGSAWVLLEVEARDPAAADRQAEALASSAAPGSPPLRPIPFENADEMWTRRGESGVALDRELGPRVREDVAVPVGRTDDLLDALARISADEHVPLYLYGHLGEGSVHPNFAVDPESPAAARVRERTLLAALALDGTVSAEHGIGTIKRPYVERELGSDAVEWLRAVKAWCDPDGILNPGKLYPAPQAAGRSSPSP
ncbi:MAG TPA: FAD-binding oxidoreductase [Thermoplasmata archaeon]|nr:FAD-binding oxidoreductase [Thermoplasmata archaeon]